MEREELEKIFDETKSSWNGDNAMQGLHVIGKYFDIKKKDILCDAAHDIIYSVEVDEILEAGLTEEDAKTLAKLNWMIDKELNCLACFT
jgi:hypothetical protein